MEVGRTPTQHEAMAPSSSVCIQIPDGLWPGDSMAISVGEQTFDIIVPDGVAGGDFIDVDVPAAPAPSSSSVVVAVPDGCYAGDAFDVDFDGRCFTISVPDGCGPGDEIEVAVPPAADEAEEPPRRKMVARASREAGYEAQELVGMRAMVVRLVTNGLLNGRKGSIVSYDEEKDIFKLAIDKMFPYVWQGLTQCLRSPA